MLNRFTVWQKPFAFCQCQCLSVAVPVYSDTIRRWLLKNPVCTLWRSAQAVSTWQEIQLLTTYTTHPDLQHGLAVLIQGLDKLLAGLLKWQLYASILTDSQVLLLTSAEPAGIPTWGLQQKASSVHYLILWRTCKQSMKSRRLRFSRIWQSVIGWVAPSAMKQSILLYTVCSVWDQNCTCKYTLD